MKIKIKNRFYSLKCNLIQGMWRDKIIAHKGDIFRILSEPKYSSINDNTKYVEVEFIKNGAVRSIPYDLDHFELIEDDALLKLLYGSVKP